MIGPAREALGRQSESAGRLLKVREKEKRDAIAAAPEVRAELLAG